MSAGLLQQGDLVVRQHSADVEQYYQTITQLAHATNEVSTDAITETGRWLDLVAIELQHFIDCIDHHTDDLETATTGNLQNHDAGPRTNDRGVAAKAQPKVDHGHHCTTQVDHAEDTRRHHRHTGQPAVLDDFTDGVDVDGLAEMAGSREFDAAKTRLGGDEAFFAAILSHLSLYRWA